MSSLILTPQYLWYHPALKKLPVLQYEAHVTVKSQKSSFGEQWIWNGKKVKLPKQLSFFKKIKNRIHSMDLIDIMKYTVIKETTRVEMMETSNVNVQWLMNYKRKVITYAERTSGLQKGYQ